MDAAAVRLADGRVLVAGGSPREGISNPVLASAELYDPTTGTFAPTGSLKTARSAATAVLLADGRALILGGFGCPPKPTRCAPDEPGSFGSGLASAELYDPATGTFTAAGSMATERQDATALPMPDGRVLVLGWDTLVEAYDPARGRFVRVGSLLKKYVGWTATLLPSGKVLVIGKWYTPEAELFDPATGRSTAISMANLPDLKNMDTTATATLLPTGNVLVFATGYLLNYDPAANTFTELGTASEPGKRWFSARATLLADGEVLYAGGVIEPTGSPGQGSVTKSAGLFDPVTGFHLIHPMVVGRTDHCAIMLADGSVLFAGGENDSSKVLSSAELFIP
jgi:hypothetical protein